MYKYNGESFTMNTKNYIQLTSLIAIMLLAVPASATSIYSNNISALNINMLTDTFASYTHNGENLSDNFVKKTLYGTMTRFDEYGDDGTTLKNTQFIDNESDFLFKNVWADVKHINGPAHYEHISSRARFNLVTLGVTTKSVNLKYGDIYFGAFGGYINSDFSDIDSYGNVGGVFANYKFQKLDTTMLINIGSLNNDSNNTDFNNSWTNLGIDSSLKFNIDKTFLIKPSLYIGYTYVASDDLYKSGDLVWSKDYNFLNIAPSVQFIKEIVPDWYGAFSAKYMAHFGGNNDIHIAGITKDGINTDNYFDIGLDIDHNFQQFVFGGKIHKQIGGFDSWSASLNVKYIF